MNKRQSLVVLEEESVKYHDLVGNVKKKENAIVKLESQIKDNNAIYIKVKGILTKHEHDMLAKDKRITDLELKLSYTVDIN